MVFLGKTVVSKGQNNGQLGIVRDKKINYESFVALLGNVLGRSS